MSDWASLHEAQHVDLERELYDLRERVRMLELALGVVPVRSDCALEWSRDAITNEPDAQ